MSIIFTRGDFLVIYVDVLFIINFFINYFLLGVCSKFSKINAKTYRLILASLIGGLYSLIILVDNIPAPLIIVSKLLIAVIMLTVAFDFKRLSSFVKTCLVFLFSNLVFLGTIIGVCVLFKPRAVAVKNSIVYFDVSAKLLIGCALVAYLLSCLIIRFYNRKLLKKEIYTITIFADGNKATMYAFLDTGNHLREPFSDSPVIIAKKDKLEGFVNDKNMRLVPTSTVNSTALLTAFRADKITIKSSSQQEEVVNNVYVALSDKINSDSYSAILNADILHI